MLAIGALEIALSHVKASFLGVQIADSLRIGLAIGPAAHGLERLITERQRFVRRKCRSSVIRRLLEIGRGARPILAPGEVIGEHRVVLGEPVRVQLLDRLADAAGAARGGAA